jgi:sialidase-1
MVKSAPLFMLVIFLFSASYAQDREKSSTPPLFDQVPLFVSGQDGINTYRIPSLICTKKGTVLAFCDGSPTHLVMKRSTGNTGPMVAPERKYPRISESRSKEKNMTWEPMQILIHSKNNDAYMNPVPVIDSGDGSIILLVNHYPKYGEIENEGKGVTEVWILRSTDEGATWSEPKDITASVGNIALGPGIGIQLKKGRLVVPVYDGVIFSDDHGKTWKAGGKTPAPLNECQVVELANGSLMLNTRGYPLRTITISHDGGNTWGELHRDSTLTDSKLWGGCQASLIRYSRKDEGADKNRLLFSNPADTLYRFDMTVRLSYDEGKTWPVSRIIKKGTGAYSCLTVFPDGTIGLIYETGNCNNDFVEYYANLSFARFNLEWLVSGENQ